MAREEQWPAVDYAWSDGATAVLMSVLRTARPQDRPLLETIKTLLMNAWAGKNPRLLTDVLADSS